MWTDEEVVLLLSVVRDYKSTKNEDLVAKFQERYPKTTSSQSPHILVTF